MVLGGTSGLTFGAFAIPAPLLVVEVGAAPIHYVHGTATLIYEFAPLSPAGLDCSFPHFGIGVPDCPVTVLVDVSGRVATDGGTILVSDPNPGFGVKATWALQTSQGCDIFSDGLNLPFTSSGGLFGEFSYTKSFSLIANRVYRIRMDVNAEVAASTLPASSFALIDPVLSFAPGVDPGVYVSVQRRNRKLKGLRSPGTGLPRFIGHERGCDRPLAPAFGDWQEQAGSGIGNSSVPDTGGGSLEGISTRLSAREYR